MCCRLTDSLSLSLSLLIILCSFRCTFAEQAANLVEAVTQLMSHFDSYNNIPKISEMKGKFHAIQLMLKQEVFTDFHNALSQIALVSSSSDMRSVSEGLDLFFDFVKLSYSCLFFVLLLLLFLKYVYVCMCICSSAAFIQIIRPPGWKPLTMLVWWSTPWAPQSGMSFLLWSQNVM